MSHRWCAQVRSIAQNLLLGGVSMALLLAAAEGALRRYLPFAGFVFRPHPRYHYTLAPNTRKLFVHSAHNGGGTVLVTVNAEGFRGEALSRRGEPRIVVYGDSCIEADYSRLQETFTKRLEARLGALLGFRVEAVNAGVNGYGPDQARRRFEDEVRWLRPRAVVFTIFADNDFGDLVRNGLYRLDGTRLVEADAALAPPAREAFTPVGDDGGLEIWGRLRHLIRRSRRQHRRTPAEREARQQAALAAYIENSLGLCRQEYEARVLRSERLVSDLYKDHYDADVSFFPDSDAARYKRALLEAVLRDLRRAAETAGVPVIVLVVPSPIDICDDWEIAVDTSKYPRYDRRRLSAAAAACARRAGLPVVDLFEPFRSAGADRLYYRRGEDHWNAAGQDLAAGLVAEHIAARGGLPAQ